MRPFRRNAQGFTLIEVVVAISVFALLTVGLTPLLVSSVRGSGLSRSYTIGKNIASDAMEGARGLPFYIQNTTATTTTSTPQKKDLLDLYYPNGDTSGTVGYQPSVVLPAPGGETLTHAYRTVCTAGVTTSNPACPVEMTGAALDTAPRATRLPSGYTLEFYAQFVKAVPGTSSAAETYAVEPPPTGYSWSSTTLDVPPASLIRLTVRVTWTFLGRPRSFKVTSLLGERKLATVKVRGAGQIAYTAKVLTSFVVTSGTGPQVSELQAIRGAGTSSILTRLLAGATQEVRGAEVTLTRPPTVANPSPSPSTIQGVTDFPKAPPSSTPPSVTAAESFLLHPDLPGTPAVAFVAPTSTTNMSLSVEESLPIATGGWRFENNDTSQQGASLQDRVQTGRTFWVTNQADNLVGSVMRFTDDPMFTMHPQGTGSGSSGTAITSATTTRLDASRKVETAASVSFRNACLLPTNFIPDGCVVKISNFTASVNCKSTAATSGSNPASATGEYSFELSYWSDPLNNSSTADGRYVPVTTPSGSSTIRVSTSDLTTATDLLAAVKTTNPLVYDNINPLLDIYLFPRPATTQRGYLQDWSMLRSIPFQVLRVGRLTGVQLNGAIQITTSPTNPALEQTGMNISLGSLNCTAEDNR